MERGCPDVPKGDPGFGVFLASDSSISELIRMTASMLLKSWAMPPASRPVASIRWECSNWAWSCSFSSAARLFSVTSWNIMANWPLRGE